MDKGTSVADVIAVYPDRVRIAVRNLTDFASVGEQLSVGSYLRVSDSNDCAIIAIIENFAIELKEGADERTYIIEASPIGFLDTEKKFHRGGNSIAIPPTSVEPAKTSEIQQIYNQVEEFKRFEFCKHARAANIRVPVDGDKFFNKHIAIVGATGSGKSHTVTSIIQKAKSKKESEYPGLNNSHIILLDIHDEYGTAFPDANKLSADTLQLPYWLLNEEELEELFVEAGENQAYNQVSLLRRIVTRNKEKHSGNPRITFGTPTYFSINEVLRCIINLSRETLDSNDRSQACIKDASKEPFSSDDQKFDAYFPVIHSFDPPKQNSVVKGPYNDGSLEKFISRLKDRLEDERLQFLFSKEITQLKFDDVLCKLLGYESENSKNVTVVDLSGVPFEVLSITVSLISRLIFEYGYFCKRHGIFSQTPAPFLIVYEEAHKYVPKLQGAKYNSCRISIERIAKEGRKYGVTLVIVSQRPSEISETIFAQCNNFVAMRLTNPDDQAYVRRLLPDSLGPLTETLPTLTQGEAVLIGDSVVMPSLVLVDICSPEPSSSDIPYLQYWKKQWQQVDFPQLTAHWSKANPETSKAETNPK